SFIRHSRAKLFGRVSRQHALILKMGVFPRNQNLFSITFFLDWTSSGVGLSVRKRSEPQRGETTNHLCAVRNFVKGCVPMMGCSFAPLGRSSFAPLTQG